MKTFFHISIFYFLFFLCTSWKTYSQPHKLEFEHLSGRQGLPKNWIWSISQDKEGFMWFGTYDGLYKYDGYTATSYVLNPADPTHSLRANLISGIYEDRKGRLWVVTWGGGLHLVDKRTGKVKAYPIDARHSSMWDSSNSILEDKSGNLWLGTALGLARFNPDNRKYTLYATPNKKGLSQIREDGAGNLWSGSYRLDPKTGKYTLFPVPTPTGKQITSALGFDIDSAGVAWMGTEFGIYYLNTHQPDQYRAYVAKGLVNKSIIRIRATGNYLWVGSSEGLQRVDKRTQQIVAYRSDPAQPGSLSNNFISALYWDRAENFWVSTANGINKASMQAKPFQAYQIIPTPATFHQIENEIFSVVERKDGTIWVSSAGHGLYKFDPETQRFSPVFVNEADKATPKVRSQGWPLLEDQLGHLWVGTGSDNGLCQLDQASGKFLRYPCRFMVRMLAEDASGKLWLAGASRELASFNPLTKKFTYYESNEKDSTSLVPGFINDLMVSKKGEVWLATTTGVGRMNPVNGRSTRYEPNYRSPTGSISDHHAMALYEDATGIIWIGTHGGGLNRLDPKTNTFTYFTTQQGLPSNRVMSLIGDKNGNFWLGTGNGLSRFNPRTNTYRNFDMGDGLPGNEFLERGSVFSRNGKVFFGNKDGLVIFNPDSIQDQVLIPPVYVTGFKVLEKNQPVPVGAIDLPYDKNFISFEFVALNYDAPERNQYAYRLIGLEKNWVYSGNRRFASYTGLDPGTYVFRVKASSDGRHWKEAKSIELIIHPPWWRTYWAYALYAIVFAGTLYGLIYYSVARERLKADLKLKSIQSEKLQEMDKLKSHFFANLSHEFRTPLTLILAPLEKLIANAKENPAQLKLFYSMRHNAQRLLHLINQLLDLTKFEAGKMTLELTDGNLMQVIKSVVFSFSSLAERRQIKFKYQFPGTNPVAYFDADKLEKIISNLLSNAFKFTPEGGEIILSVRLDAANEQEIPKRLKQPNKSVSIKILQLDVQDNGVGIPPERLEKIFDRFYQIDASHTREQEGTGIGLALVKELIDLQEGQILVESLPGIRTCFTVRLPLAITEMEEIAVVDNFLNIKHQNLPIGQEDNKEITDISTEVPIQEDAPIVLIIEDNPELRYYMRETLQKNYKILEAANGEEGLTQAMQTIPDLVVSDIMMPKMDGIELCQKLKVDEKTSHIPVILLTAKADSQSKITGLQIGADDYITKPFEAGELEVRIRNLIAGRRKLREHFSREITLQPSDINITSADECFLQRLMQAIESSIADTNFSVEHLGREMGMSRMQLYRKLNALTAYSPSDFIKKVRLQRAAQLLRQGVGTVSEISYLVGFSSHAYFSKCFHDQYGKTPSDYLAEQAKVM